ncbi:MAG: hypothetical protein HW409_1106 [candidate division NC10 bacterium]|nr:hypothetical protein [candidate division NC10 bacterium]
MQTAYPGGHEPVLALIQELMTGSDCTSIEIRKGNFRLYLRRSEDERR